MIDRWSGREAPPASIELRLLARRTGVDPLQVLRVADVLRLQPYRGARFLTAGVVLERRIAHVNVMQVPTAQFARSGDLILAADDAFRRSPGGPGELVGALADRDVAAVVVRRTGIDDVRDEVVARSRERELALIELPDSAHLSEVLTGTLEALVSTQATELRRAAAVRDRLGDLVLAGGGLQDLPDVIAELAAGEVAVVSAEAQVLAASAGAEPDAAAAVAAAWLEEGMLAPAEAWGGWAVWPVLAGDIRLGCLVARLPGELRPERLAALEYGANSAAIEILHRHEAADADARLRVRFVSDLLSGSLEPEVMHRRAVALGWNAGGRFLIVLARGAAPRPTLLVARAAERAGVTVAMEWRGACLVIALVPDGDESTGRAIAAALTAAGDDVRVGISTVLPSVCDLPTGLRQADEALRVAEVFDRRRRVRRYEELGPLEILADVPVAELRAFADEALAALVAAEPGPDGPLAATLHQLIDTGLNVAETARRGGWHYNTVRYRMRRLTGLLGDFMGDGDRLHMISLALLLRRELGAGPSQAAAERSAGLQARGATS